MAKIFVESSAENVAGGRTNVIHWALARSSPGETGWGVWAKPNQLAHKSWRWEGAPGTLTDFVTWVSRHKGSVRYVVQSSREQDLVP